MPNIVGATHRPWLDSLPGQMQGVDVVDMEEVLRPQAPGRERLAGPAKRGSRPAGGPLSGAR